MEIKRFIDHSLLSPTTTPSAIEVLCREALEFEFYAICIPPNYVALAKEFLKNSEVKIVSVIGFPLGPVLLQ